MQGTLRGVDVAGAPAFAVIAGGYGAAICRPLASLLVRQEIIA